MQYELYIWSRTIYGRAEGETVYFRTFDKLAIWADLSLKYPKKDIQMISMTIRKPFKKMCVLKKDFELGKEYIHDYINQYEKDIIPQDWSDKLGENN